MSHFTNSGTKTGRKLFFSRVSEATLDTFWARFWRRSVLQGHCVSCPVGCVFSFGRKSSSSNRSSRRVLCLILQTVVQKLVENYFFSRVSDDTLGTFWARSWRRSVLQGHCVSLSGRVRFQLREEEQQQQQEQQEGSMSHCTKTMVQKLVENYCFF